MSRLRSSIVCTAALYFVLFKLVNSVKYKVTFDPNKLWKPYKDTKLKPLTDFIYFSNVSFTLAADGDLHVQGFNLVVGGIPSGVPALVVTTFKQKLRGRWIDLPYTYRINDLCKDYYKEGTWWYEKITKYFVGDQRGCPAKKNVPIPFNFTANLELNLPTPLPEGEYMSRSVVSPGDMKSFMDNYCELHQV